MKEEILTKKGGASESDIFMSADYKRSRRAYTAQCAVEYYVSILVADAFLAKLLTYIGVSDALNGIISSFISLAFMFQLFSIGLVKRMKSVKRTVIICDVLANFGFMGVFLVSLLPASDNVKTVLVMAGILLGYFCMHLVYSVCYNWANSFVDAKKRGEYSATKEMLSLFSGIVFTLVTGFAIDKLEADGNMRGVFLLIATLILVLNVLDFVFLMMIKDAPKRDESLRYSLREIVEKTFKNKSFRSIVYLTVLWDVGRYFTIGFMGVYKTKELMLSVGTVQVINMVGNLARVVVSRPFGRYSDKTSFAKGFTLALSIAAAGFFVNIFTTPDSVWCVAVFTLLYSVAQAGTNQNSYNIVYSYVDSEYISQAMALKNCIGGIFGFAASVAAGKILTAISNNGNTLFGIHIYGQQALSLISFAFVLAAAIYIKLVIEKLKAEKK